MAKNNKSQDTGSSTSQGDEVSSFEQNSLQAEGVSAGSEMPSLPDGAAQLIVNGQYIKDLSFENPNVLKLMQASGNQPEISIDLGVNVQDISEGSYEVALQIRVETKRDGAMGFIVELAYAGLFTLRGWQADQVEPILFIEGPKLLFPFARSIISNLTRDGGFPPLNLNPIDFSQLYRRRVAQREAQAGGAGSATVN